MDRVMLLEVPVAGTANMRRGWRGECAGKGMTITSLFIISPRHLIDCIKLKAPGWAMACV